VDAVSKSLKVVRGALAALGGGLLLAAAGAVPAAADSVPLTSLIGPPITGTWKTQDGTEITISPCDQGLCGYLTWVIIPKDFAAQCKQMDHASFSAAMVDQKNPDKSLQTRPILNLQMMTVTPTNDPATYTAQIYNPNDGSTNNIEAFLLDSNNTLRIGGACIGSICAVTQDWPRVTAHAGSPDYACKPD
jgi:uncharacterized protein (DUF2147 family)